MIKKVLVAGALLFASVVSAAASTIDFAPVVTPIIQAIGVIVSVLAIPLAWKAIEWIKNKVGLQNLEIDDNMRGIVNQGLQKALGFGISKVKDAVAGLPMTAEVKNAVLAESVNFALAHIPDALKYFGMDDPQKLAEALESRLGLAEIQTSTGQAVLPAAPSPAA